MRKTYRQDPETGKFIEKSEWLEKYGQETNIATQIMPDIPPTESPIEPGVVWNSRSHRRADMRKHNLIEMGDHKPEFMK